LHGKSFLPQATYLSDTDTTWLSTAHDSNTLGRICDLSKSKYDYLIQKTHSVSTSDIAIMAHPGISYLASSSLSSWIIDFGAQPTWMVNL